MGIKESIGWATKTWNPVTGCWGPGGTQERPNRCFYCYAHRMAKRLRGRFGYPKNDPFRPTLHPEQLEEPLNRKKPTCVFLCSMGDMFGDDIPNESIDHILEVIGACPQHTFIILAKRPENIEAKFYEVTEDNPCRELGGGDYLPNLWLGVTVETQKMAQRRIPELLRIPAAMRFISIEPILGPVNIERWFPDQHHKLNLNWLIIGAMTGPGARQHAPKKEWIENIVCQAKRFNIPVFMKGNLRPYWEGELVQKWPDGGNPELKKRR